MKKHTVNELRELDKIVPHLSPAEQAREELVSLTRETNALAHDTNRIMKELLKAVQDLTPATDQAGQKKPVETLNSRIRLIMADGKVRNYYEVWQALPGSNEASVRGAMSALAKSKHLNRLRHGIYQLAAKQD